MSLLHKKDQQLNIETSYSRTVEELYVDLTLRTLKQHNSLGLLETCEISSRSLDIPSWVPDFSRPLNAPWRNRLNWSACGWMSSQATIIDTNVTCVKGINVTLIEKIIKLNHHENANLEDQLQTLRELQPPNEVATVYDKSEVGLVAKLLRSLLGDMFEENYMFEDIGHLNFEQCMEFLKTVWSTNTSAEEIIDPLFTRVLHIISENMVGRCLFYDTDRSIGVAPVDTKPGDIVCVLLGSRFPIVLRPFSQSASNLSYQVVGACNVPGLMKGEAIYGTKLPNQYRAVKHLEDRDRWIDYHRLGLFDPKTQTLKTDPAQVLTEMGIKVENYRRKPHLLEVLPETLRTAGVDLQDFTLV